MSNLASDLKFLEIFVTQEDLHFFFWCLYGGIFSKLVYILKMDLYGPKHVTLIWFSKTASCLTGICNFTQTCSGDKRHFTFEIIA